MILALRVTRTEYAEHRKRSNLPGTTRQAVSDAIRDGRLDAGLSEDKSQIVDVAAADEAWRRNTMHNRRPKSTRTAVATAGVPDLDESIKRKEAANAELAERKLAKDKSELLEIAVVRRAIEKRISIAKTHLAGLPGKLASRLNREDHRRIAPVVKAVVRQVLDELADSENLDA